MDILSIIPVKFEPMSIITLLLLVAMVFIFYLVYNQIRKDLKDHKINGKKRTEGIQEDHKILKNDFEKTRGKLYDKIGEIKDDFGEMRISVARTEEMIKGTVIVQKIIQKDTEEIRKILNDIKRLDK